MNAIEIILLIILFGILWLTYIFNKSKYFRKRILQGHIGMRCKYWDGKGISHRGFVQKCEGYIVYIAEEFRTNVDEIHIDNVEPCKLG